MSAVVEAVVGNKIRLARLPVLANHVVDVYENVPLTVIVLTNKAIQVVCVIHIISRYAIITR